MNRTYAGIVETCRNRIRLNDLSVGGLHHQRATSMENSERASLDGCCCLSAVDAQSAGFGKHNLDTLVVEIVIDCSRGITSTADTRHQIVGIVATDFLAQLLADFAADNTLQARHHIGIRMRSDGTSDDVERRVGVTTPIANRLVCGIFESHVARQHRTHLRTEHQPFP